MMVREIDEAKLPKDAAEFLGMVRFYADQYGGDLHLAGTPVPVNTRGYCFSGFDEFSWATLGQIAKWEKRGFCNTPYGQHERGLIHTAYFLSDAHTEQEIAAVFAAAFLHWHTSDVPEYWRGEPFMLMEKLSWMVRDVVEVNYHHRHRHVLPVSVVGRGYTMGRPNHWQNLARIIGIDVALCCGNWRVIRSSGAHEVEPSGGIF